ncbi:hypothetical protein C2S51_026405 [Perilla frutescens var. frutescens]|nr:hypothetical protein C2S51_026405 [Perilla frutescens var. frutescens]
MISSSSSKASAKRAEKENQKQVDLNGIKDSVESISYCSNPVFFQGDGAIDELGLLPSNYEELQVQANVGALDYLYLDMFSPPFQACRNNMRILFSIKPQDSQIIRPSENNSNAFPSASIEVLRQCRSIDEPRDEMRRKSESWSTLSTNHIIELAAKYFIHSISGTREDLSAVNHTFSADDAKDIQLVQNLLSCAEKICNRHYDCASKLLEECNKVSYSRMNVIQRLVYYFTEALCEKIEHKTGTGKDLFHNLPHDSLINISAMAAIYQKLPLSQVIHYTGTQLVVDHVSKCRKVSIIDLNICCGVQQMILLKNLAARSDCPLEYVKITALAMDSDPTIEEVGVQLRIMAESLNINFSFHVISLEYILDIQQQNPLDLDPEETVVVHAAFALRHMITDENRLETLMRVIRDINPSLMIIAEAEANVNSPVFVNRFVEALFYYGAFFDYVEDCLENDDERKSLESGFFGPAIRNIVATEGEERKFRIVGINVWRAFFARFGMVEIELSKSSISHVNLVLERFDCRDSCTVCMNGKCLVVSWKETPMSSLSAWRFQGM